MKIISHEDIIKLNIDPIQCFEWVSHMLKNKSEVILPAKISMKPVDEIFYNVMPSLLPASNAAGIKVVTRYPSRKPALDSQIMLYDYEFGKMNALVDANYITTMRTGAVAAHAIDLLAAPDFQTIGFIGLGNQARATIKVLLSVYPNKSFTFKLMKYKNQHTLFDQYVRNLPNSDAIQFEYCETYRETVKGSDVVISSVTYFANDICENNCFDEGVLVVPIHTRGFMNCDLFFDKIFADDTDHVKGFKYFNRFRKFAEVSDILAGRASGREHESERIIVYNIGLAMHDIYFAQKIVEMAQHKELGTETYLHAPTKKFWL